MEQDGNIPSPNFSQQDSSSGFLGFSSTPAEGKHFKPKWGKRNRQDNWNRFGQSQAESESTNFSGHRGRGGGWRGGGGGGGGWRGGGGGGRWNGRGGGWRGGGGRGFNNSWQGGQQEQSYNRSYQRHGQGQGGWQGHNSGSSEGYFHPGMLEDPWAELEQSYGYGDSQGGDFQDDSVTDSLAAHQGEEETEQKDVMSESMIVQVGDSLCERNDKILDSTADSIEAEGEDKSENEDK